MSWVHRLGVLPLLFASFFASLSARGERLTYHGRLLDPNDQPVIANSVQFQIQIRTPGAEDCLLYQEVQTKNLSTTNGFFSLNLGDGSGTVTLVNGYSLSRVFQNRDAFTSLTGCAAGSSYLPSTGDGRRIAVRFNDGSGWEDLQTKPLSPVPQAMESMTVGGYSAQNLLRVEDAGVPQSVTPLTSTQLANLVSVANTGNVTGNAATATTATNATTAVNFSGSLSGDVTGTQSATVVARLQGRNVSATAPANGEVLKWNGTAWAPAVDGGGGGGVSSVGATAPLASSGGATPDISLAAGTVTGQTLRWGGASWSAAKLNYQDLVNNVAASPWPGASCTSGQFLTWSSVSDNFACTAVSGAMVNTALGYTPLNPANNLSDLANAATARTNLGAGDFLASGSVPMTGNIRLNGNYLSGDGGNEGLFVDSTGRVGIGTSTPSSVFNIQGTGASSYRGIMVQNTFTDTVAKGAVAIMGPRHTNTNAPFVGLATWDSGTYRQVYLGGGAWNMPDATVVKIFAADAYDETNGTNANERLRVEGAGTTIYKTLWTQDTGGATEGTLRYDGYGGVHQRADPSGNSSSYTFRSSRGTLATKTISQNGDGVGKINFESWDGDEWGESSRILVDLDSSGVANDSTPGFMAFRTTPLGSKVATEKMRITSSGNIGIGTTNPQSLLHVNGIVRATEICDENGANCRDISTGWGGGGTVTSVTSANADIGVATTTSTPVLTLNSGTGANQILKLNASSEIPAVSGVNLTALNASNLGSGTVPAARMPALTGDATMTAGTTATTVARIQGRNVVATAPLDGQVYRWNNGATQWEPVYFGVDDLRTSAGASQFSASCTASQTLTWSAVTDAFTCANIAGLDAGVITTGTIASARLPASATFWSTATGGINYAGGNLGVGAAAPAAKLDVAGDIKIANSAATCDASTEGSLRYNSTSKVMEFCNGTAWGGLGGGGNLPTCPDGDMAISVGGNWVCSSTVDPVGFDFMDQAGVGLSTLITSEIVQIMGFTGNRNVNISGAGSPQYRICADYNCAAVVTNWTNAEASLQSNQFLQLRQTSSGSANTARTATLTIGAALSDWSITTSTLPVVGSTNSSQSSTEVTSHTVSLPSGISNGDLLVLVFGKARNGSITTPAGWTQLLNVTDGSAGGTERRVGVYYKVASGSEGASVNVTTGDNSRSVHFTYRITSYQGTPEALHNHGGSSMTPNPPALTPSWGSTSTLWIAAAFSRDTNSFTAYPNSYSNGVTLGGTGSYSIRGAAARRINVTATEDPSSFTTDTSREWTAITIGIRP